VGGQQPTAFQVLGEPLKFFGAVKFKVKDQTILAFDHGCGASLEKIGNLFAFFLDCPLVGLRRQRLSRTEVCRVIHEPPLGTPTWQRGTSATRRHFPKCSSDYSYMLVANAAGAAAASRIGAGTSLSDVAGIVRSLKRQRCTHPWEETRLQILSRLLDNT